MKVGLAAGQFVFSFRFGFGRRLTRSWFRNFWRLEGHLTISLWRSGASSLDVRWGNPHKVLCRKCTLREPSYWISSILRSSWWNASSCPDALRKRPESLQGSWLRLTREELIAMALEDWSPFIWTVLRMASWSPMHPLTLWRRRKPPPLWMETWVWVFMWDLTAWNLPSARPRKRVLVSWRVGIVPTMALQVTTPPWPANRAVLALPEPMLVPPLHRPLVWSHAWEPILCVSEFQRMSRFPLWLIAPPPSASVARLRSTPDWACQHQKAWWSTTKGRSVLTLRGSSKEWWRVNVLWPLWEAGLWQGFPSHLCGCFDRACLR